MGRTGLRPAGRGGASRLRRLFAAGAALDALEGSLRSLPPSTIVFDILFVTSRFPSEPASDRTSHLLQRLVALPAPPISIIRSPVSYSERPFRPGKYGEKILAGSAD